MIHLQRSTNVPRRDNARHSFVKNRNPVDGGDKTGYCVKFARSGCITSALELSHLQAGVMIVDVERSGLNDRKYIYSQLLNPHVF